MMNKAIASGLIGLIALGGGAVAAIPGASAQETTDDTDRTERQEARAEHRAEKLETLTSVLGVTADEFKAAKQDGQTVADIAAAQSVDVQSVIDTLVANAQARIDAKLEAGDIDADRAAAKSESIEDRITDKVNGESDRGHRGHRGRHTRGQGPSA